MEFEEVRYGMLMMVLCDREGRVFDVWITFGSVLEVRAFRERKKRSLWFRGLVVNCVVYGDRGYRGCEGVIVVIVSIGENIEASILVVVQLMELGVKEIIAKAVNPPSWKNIREAWYK